MTTPGPGRGTKPLEHVPGTRAEVVHWTSPTGDGECTVVWLATDRLNPRVASTEVTAIERQRAAGYTHENDRLLSLGSAWLTRRLVAISLDVPLLEAPIVRHCAQCAKPHGRPVVCATTREGATVRVSATHSGGLVGVALSTSEAVGLDVEDPQTRGPDVWPTVRRVLGLPGLPEGRSWGPEDARSAATAWVRTEAVLKATGQGLAVSSRLVSITTGESARVTHWPWGDPKDRVSIFDLSPGRRYIASLAVIHDRLIDFAAAPPAVGAKNGHEH